MNLTSGRREIRSGNTPRCIGYGRAGNLPRLPGIKALARGAQGPFLTPGNAARAGWIRVRAREPGLIDQGADPGQANLGLPPLGKRPYFPL